MPWWLIPIVFAIVGFTVRPYGSRMQSEREAPGSAFQRNADDIGAWRHEYTAWQSQLNAVGARIGLVNAGLYVIAGTAVAAYAALRDHGGALADWFWAPLIVAIFGVLGYRVRADDTVNPALELTRAREAFPKRTESERLDAVVRTMVQSVDAQERILSYKEWVEVVSALSFTVAMVLVGLLAPMDNPARETERGPTDILKQGGIMAKMDVRKGFAKAGETIREGFGLVFNYDATQRRGFTKRVREVDNRLAVYLGNASIGTNGIVTVHAKKGASNGRRPFKVRAKKVNRRVADVS